MLFSLRHQALALLVAGLAITTTTHQSFAQSGSKMSATAKSKMTMQPHGMKTMKATLALSGYCPVCIVKKREWVKGSPEHQVTYDGKTYYFPGAGPKDMFLADPAKYVPALGGDCTVCYAKMNKRAAGSVQHAAIHKGRLFLFPGEGQKAEFVANPTKYSDIDLAAGGKCVVCKTEMGKDAPGNPEIAAVHGGMRYFFPGDKQRAMFLANPGKYTGPMMNDHSSTTPMKSATSALVSIQGTSACAGCEYGVTPLGSPNELGLAVRVKDQVIVVEDAHKLYPEIYKARFDAIQLAVKGQVLKSDGKFVWVKPSSLSVLN